MSAASPNSQASSHEHNNIPGPQSIPPNTDSNQTPEIVNEDANVNDDLDSANLKSEVWKHFKRRKIDGETKAVCNYCDKKLVGHSKSGTSHLREHSNRCPRRKFRDIRDIRQKILVNEQNKAEGKITLTGYSFDQAVSGRELANMIILHEYPLSIVEHVGFRKYSASLQPLFTMVCRNTIKSDILKIYDYEKEKVMKKLDKNRSRVAITTDMWTSSNRKRGFMVVTTHFIDDSWTLHSRVIRFIYVPSPHMKEVLADALLDCFLDWNLDRNLSTITMDNCTTNDAMVRLIMNKLQRSTLMLHGSMLHMRCAAHILNLIVQEGLTVMEPRIAKIRDSVLFWTASTKRRQKFDDTKRQLHIKCTKELVLECKTRWNSIYMMINTALTYKDVFFRLNQKDSSYTCIPSEEEWENAKLICGKLELFYNVTELFSGTKYPTANIYFPKVYEVKIALAEWFLSSTGKVRDMAFHMFEKFGNYWNVINGIMGVATVLDPRYKMMPLEFYFPQIYGDEADSEIKRIRDICYGLMNEYSSQIVDKSDGHDSETTSKVTQSSAKDSLSNFDHFVNSRKKGGHGNAKLELDHYLEDDVLPRSNDFDILAWWKSNGPKYPILQRIARDVLAIPVSTVASESAFSTSGRLLSPS